MAFLLRRTLLRGETPVFMMEMPLYKMPGWMTVLRRALDSGWMFLKRAGTLIMASMVIVWASLYFPSGDFEQTIVKLEQDKANARDKDEANRIQDEINQTHGQWKAQSILGQFGHWMEPVVKPLGWDWRIGTAALASFPAREVMVMTLGIIFAKGEGDADDKEFSDDLIAAIREEKALFTIPVGLSVMVFFALCSQCVSTLVVIRRETNSWGWPIFTFVYMTVLAYVGALLTYQIGSLF
jgi:ferrous iron transport protein B